MIRARRSKRKNFSLDTSPSPRYGWFMAEHISEVPPPPRRRLRRERPIPSKLISAKPASALLPTPHLVFREQESFEESVSESKRHLEARTTLYLVLRKAYEIVAQRRRERRNVAIGSEQFVYYDSTDPKKCFSPDVFVKVNSDARDFNTWNVWEHGNPDLVVEIVSDSDRNASIWSDKFSRYQDGGVQEVVRFDAAAQNPITIWDRVEDRFVERKQGGSLPQCKTLGLYWVVVPDEVYGPQLRLAKDRTGKHVLPTPIENELRLEQELAEERRARAQAEHDKRLAEHDKRLAEQRQHEEAQARRLAEQRQHEEAEARRLAEMRQHEEAEARARLEEEVVRLRAELDRLRGQTP